MKKSLIALAVFGAFSGAAMANSVTLYGLIDMGVTHFTGIAPTGGGAGTVSSTGMSSGVQNGSRIGLKGDEDLGGGLKAIFDAETGFCATGTNQAGSTTQTAGNQTYCTGGGFMQRQSYLGLAGDFGTVLAGRVYTTNFNDEASVDPFGWGLTGNIGNMSLVSQLSAARANQVLAYVSPNFSGFSFVGAYVFAPNPQGTVPTASGNGSNVTRAYTIDGTYAAGPVMAGATYTEVTNVLANPTSNVNDGAVKLWDVRGSYDFGVAKLSGIYESDKLAYTSGNNKFWMLGATVPVGPGSILASYAEAKNDQVTGTPTGKQYAVGYTYNLSKQTDLYTSYAHISNSNGAAFTVGDSTDGFKGVAGQSSSGFAVGIDHRF